MKTMVYLFVTAIVLCSVSALAASIPIVNPSFESPDVPTGTYRLWVPDGWTYAGDPGGGNRFIEMIDGYVGYYPMPYPDGTQMMSLNANPVNLWQNTGVKYQEGGTYTLRVGLAKYGDIALYAGLKLWSNADPAGGPDTGTELAYEGFGSDAIPLGVWTDKSVSVTINPGNAAIGKYIVVQLQQYYSGTGYDNVRLTAVPEPGAMMALGTGLIGLVGFVMRRRK